MPAKSSAHLVVAPSHEQKILHINFETKTFQATIQIKKLYFAFQSLLQQLVKINPQSDLRNNYYKKHVFLG